MITTHYIEEARQASVVGLMRNGALLAEENPSKLMETYNLTSLEDVFLKLCMRKNSQVIFEYNRFMTVISVLILLFVMNKVSLFLFLNRIHLQTAP